MKIDMREIFKSWKIATLLAYKVPFDITKHSSIHVQDALDMEVEALMRLTFSEWWSQE